MKIERAKPADAEALTKIAFAAKRHWDYHESWIASWTPQLTITPEYMAANKVFVAVDEDRPVGFYSLVLSSIPADLDHLWIEPRFIGTGLGRQLFEHAVHTARQAGAKSFTIESDPNAEGFYRKMGAVPHGQTVTEIEGQERVLPILLFNVPAGEKSVSE